MDAIVKALWYIESHTASVPSLEDVAEASGLSRFHLSRTFSAVVGRSPSAYLRGRRLSEAAKVLAAGAPDILSVALDAGYGSHEAFTRAFREQFGATPEDVRAGRSTEPLTLVEAIRMPDKPAANIAPDRIFKTETMLFAGLRKYFRFDDRGGIPMIWQAFGPHIGTIPGEKPGAAYGLCLAPADQKDEAGFDYFAAVQMKSLDDLPEELSGARIDGRSWAAFKHAGHVSSIGSTCAAAGEWLAQSGRGPKSGSMQMIEFYGPQFDARTGNGGCEVWVPVV
jgi:AraC family transcriptional regulator